MADVDVMEGSAPDAAGAVRRELQAAYARAGQAYREKDPAALMGMVTPDFTQRMPDGQIISYAEAEAALREWFATADTVTGYDVRINGLTVRGDEAVAEVAENVSTTIVDPAGQRHACVQANTSQVTWVRTPRGWQIRGTEYRSAKMTVDGRPVQPLMTPTA